MLKLFRKKLPHCDTLFEKYFSPWYPESDRPKMTRPDMYQIAAYQGEPLDLEAIQYLKPDYLIPVKTMVNEEMAESAIEDFKLITNMDKIDLISLMQLTDFTTDKKLMN